MEIKNKRDDCRKEYKRRSMHDAQWWKCECEKILSAGKTTREKKGTLCILRPMEIILGIIFQISTDVMLNNKIKCLWKNDSIICFSSYEIRINENSYFNIKYV